MKLAKCPVTGLMLPPKLIDDKTSLKNEINKVVENAVNSVKLNENYFLILHAKFDKLDPDAFVISQIVASLKIPPFTANQMVFWVSPSKGVVELLWMVPPAKQGEKLKVEFNETGVAYLQVKGAMAS